MSWNGATDVAAWQVLAGPSPSTLAPVGAPVANAGFETDTSCRNDRPLRGGSGALEQRSRAVGLAGDARFLAPRRAGLRSAMRDMLPAVAVRSFPSELDAVFAFLVAAGVALLLTPLTMRFARRVGAIDQPRERGLSDRETPLLGGLAIFVAAGVAGAIWLPASEPWIGILLAAALITVVGALDDRFDFRRG